jgi:hypothetical protein
MANITGGMRKDLDNLRINEIRLNDKIERIEKLTILSSEINDRFETGYVMSIYGDYPNMVTQMRKDIEVLLKTINNITNEH